MRKFHDDEWDALVNAAYQRIRETEEAWDRLGDSLAASRLIRECGGVPPRQSGDTREGFREDESGN